LLNWISPGRRLGGFHESLGIDFLPAALASGGRFRPARFDFVAPLSKLLLDLFGDKINGGVKVALAVLGKQIRSRH
jgi:hypothetical protein